MDTRNYDEPFNAVWKNVIAAKWTNAAVPFPTISATTVVIVHKTLNVTNSTKKKALIRSKSRLQKKPQGKGRHRLRLQQRRM